MGVPIDVVATGGYRGDCYMARHEWNWVFLLPLLIESPPPPQQRDGSYKIWQLQEELLINLECSSDLHPGEVMAGEKKKTTTKKSEWLLPFNLYLLCCFSFSSFVSLSLFSLTFAPLHPPSPCDCRLLKLLVFLLFSPFSPALHVWLLADMHTGSIAHLPNFSSPCLAPTPVLILLPLTYFSFSMCNY